MRPASFAAASQYCDNAARSSPAGGTVDMEARAVAGDAVEIRVRDQGPGVPKEFREKVFDKYVRLGASEAGGQPRSNMGLGLTFCRLAVEAHGGKIWVEDNQPKGACFCVRLPIRSTRKPATHEKDIFQETPKA